MQNNLKYGIYPPKMAGDNLQVYYRDIVVLIIEDDEIIGARKYDYNGTSKVVSYAEFPYDKRLSTEFDHITNVETATLLNSVTRSTWLFNTEQEAFVQKIWLLKKLRDQFEYNQKENRKVFDIKIPPMVETYFDKIRTENPEYFL